MLPVPASSTTGYFQIFQEEKSSDLYLLNVHNPLSASWGAGFKKIRSIKCQRTHASPSSTRAEEEPVQRPALLKLSADLFCAQQLAKVWGQFKIVRLKARITRNSALLRRFATPKRVVLDARCEFTNNSALC
jgi:hypothetical protein